MLKALLTLITDAAEGYVSQDIFKEEELENIEE